MLVDAVEMGSTFDVAERIAASSLGARTMRVLLKGSTEHGLLRVTATASLQVPITNQTMTETYVQKRADRLHNKG